jgi:hypothetical protein
MLTSKVVTRTRFKRTRRLHRALKRNHEASEVRRKIMPATVLYGPRDLRFEKRDTQTVISCSFPMSICMVDLLRCAAIWLN